MNRGHRRAEWRALRTGPLRGNMHRVEVSHATRSGPSMPSRERAKTPAAINLRVGELLLHGFERGRARGIADALQHSLTELLTARAIPDSWSSGARVGKLDGGRLRLTVGASPRAIGEELARRVLECRTDPLS